MEPVAYFVTLGTALVAYFYFLLTKENPDYQQIRERLFLRWQGKKLKENAFDSDRHDKLIAELSRYRRYISQFKAKR